MKKILHNAGLAVALLLASNLSADAETNMWGGSPSRNQAPAEKNLPLLTWTGSWSIGRRIWT